MLTNTSVHAEFTKAIIKKLTAPVEEEYGLESAVYNEFEQEEYLASWL